MDYDGTFSDNGFLAMPQKTYEITFTPLSTLKEIDIDKFQQTLSIRYRFLSQILSKYYKSSFNTSFLLISRTIRDTYTEKPYYYWFL